MLCLTWFEIRRFIRLEGEYSTLNKITHSKFSPLASKSHWFCQGYVQPTASVASTPSIKTGKSIPDTPVRVGKVKNNQNKENI